jgi:two-component system KDP operon response regulator KdpE
MDQIPIIILSVRNQEQDKVQALDAGADDYLTKPFGVGTHAASAW